MRNRAFTVFRIEETCKNLYRSFVEGFFVKAGTIVNVPDLKAYKWSAKPEERLIRIAELFESDIDPEIDEFPEVQFPLILVYFPDFNEVETGIGSMINKSDGYFTSNKNSATFTHFDTLTKEHVKLSYVTEQERVWSRQRYFRDFSVGIDVMAETPQSRNELANLVRTMMDQYLAALSPMRDLSVPVLFSAFQYETNDNLVSYEDNIRKSFYPAFFPYGEIGVYFDNPLLRGTGEYDGIDIIQDKKLYMSSFTMESIKAECFQLIETEGFITDVCMSEEPTVTLPFKI